MTESLCLVDTSGPIHTLNIPSFMPNLCFSLRHAHTHTHTHTHILTLIHGNTHNISLSHSIPFPHTHTHTHAHTPHPPTHCISRKEGEINQQLMRSREWEAGPSRHFHLWCTLPCYYNLYVCVCSRAHVSLLVLPVFVWAGVKHVHAYPDLWVTRRGAK